MDTLYNTTEFKTDCGYPLIKQLNAVAVVTKSNYQCLQKLLKMLHIFTFRAMKASIITHRKNREYLIYLDIATELESRHYFLWVDFKSQLFRGMDILGT